MERAVRSQHGDSNRWRDPNRLFLMHFHVSVPDPRCGRLAGNGATRLDTDIQPFG
jgi:hypothetical protein